LGCASKITDASYLVSRKKENTIEVPKMNVFVPKIQKTASCVDLVHGGSGIVDEKNL
jgi:hypothetical protein